VGAKSNFLPITIGMACGAHRVYLPQYPILSEDGKSEIRRLFGDNFDPNTVNVHELVGWIEQMFEHTKKTYLVVIIPHGVPLVNLVHSNAATDQTREEYESIILSTAPMELTVPRIVDDLVLHFSGTGMVQVRYVLLDDLQRGGTPTARDRIIGSLYGRGAVERYLQVVQNQEVGSWGNLNLVALDDISCVRCRSYRREEVAAIFQGTRPRAGGLDPLPFFRQSRGTASGYQPLTILT
jgi:6-phosphofructokinase